MQSLMLPPLQVVQLEWQPEVRTVMQSVGLDPIQSKQPSQQ